jgi:hypothetical protein
MSINQVPPPAKVTSDDPPAKVRVPDVPAEGFPPGERDPWTVALPVIDPIPPRVAPFTTVIGPFPEEWLPLITRTPAFTEVGPG